MFLTNTCCRQLHWNTAVIYVARLFSRARELAESPLSAAEAYENTALAIYEAEQAAMAAVNASEAAFQKVSCWYCELDEFLT